MSMVTFTCYVKPEPQGSLKGFVLPAKGARKARAILTSDNTKMKPYRNELTRVAIQAMEDHKLERPMATKHIPVSLVIDFTFLMPESCPKKRRYPVVKPDIDKLARSTLDALTGVIFLDDSQAVDLVVRKRYGAVESVHVSARIISDELYE